MSATGWGWLLAACAIAFATKLSGYLIPARWLQGPRMTAMTGSLTIGLLGALAAMNTFAAGPSVAIDARIGAALVAALALALRLPFLLVVLSGAAAAAALRALGID